MASKLCRTCSTLSETEKPFCPECGTFYNETFQQDHDESSREVEDLDDGSGPFQMQDFAKLGLQSALSSSHTKFLAWAPLVVWALIHLRLSLIFRGDIQRTFLVGNTGILEGLITVVAFAVAIGIAYRYGGNER